jgi:hypothetical protein
MAMRQSWPAHWGRDRAAMRDADDAIDASPPAARRPIRFHEERMTQ